MSLYYCGVSDRRLPIQLRERLSFTRGRVVELNRLLRERAGLAGCALLSTCGGMVLSISHVICDDLITPCRKKPASARAPLHKLAIIQYPFLLPQMGQLAPPGGHRGRTGPGSGPSRRDSHSVLV